MPVMRLITDAVQSLRHDRAFAALAVGILAMTLGVLIAVYAIVRAVVLRPFPFADQDRLIVAWQQDSRRALPVVEVGYGEAADWRDRSRTLDDLAIFGSVNWSVTLAGERAESVPMAAVSGTFFNVMGTPPRYGRGLMVSDEEATTPRVVVISHGLWQRRFAADPGVVGRAVPMAWAQGEQAVPVEIVGVMPPDFDFPREAEVWAPAGPLMRRTAAANPQYEAVMMRWYRVFLTVGRIKPGVSLDAAREDLTGVMRSADHGGGPPANERTVVTPIARYLIGPAQPVLWTLLGGAALMLAIACANIAGLMASRASRRQRATAIRVALGASSRHVVGAALAESAVLTLGAVGGASFVAFASVRLLVWMAPAAVPRLESVSLVQPDVVLVAVGLVSAVTVLCGLGPGILARRFDATRVLAHGGAPASDPRGRRVQRGVVMTQVAIAVTLVSGTGLFLRTLSSLDRAALGFEPEGLVAVRVTPSTSDRTRWNAQYDALIERVNVLPGVRAAGSMLVRPLSGPIGWDNQPIYPGQVPARPETWGLNAHMNMQAVSPAFFETLGIRLVRGRIFTKDDDERHPGVVVVSESAARRIWPGREPIGQQLRDASFYNGGQPNAPRLADRRGGRPGCPLSRPDGCAPGPVHAGCAEHQSRAAADDSHERRSCRVRARRARRRARGGCSPGDWRGRAHARRR
jgi:putative ABC transport system permease protein